MWIQTGIFTYLRNQDRNKDRILPSLANTKGILGYGLFHEYL